MVYNRNEARKRCAKNIENDIRQQFGLGDLDGFYVVPADSYGFEIYFTYNCDDSQYNHGISDDEVEKMAQKVYDDLYEGAESIGMYGYGICRGDVANGDGFSAIVINYE